MLNQSANKTEKKKINEAKKKLSFQRTGCTNTQI